jgi:predicted Fe-Mo cluster-binding NifX family protein
MKIAIPERQGRVSPVFDSAELLWILDLESDRKTTRMSTLLYSSDPVEKARQVNRFGVNVLICGAISREARMVLSAAGVSVFPWICGSIEEVIQAYREQRLDEERFKMPGGRGLASTTGARIDPGAGSVRQEGPPEPKKGWTRKKKPPGKSLSAAAHKNR